MIIETKNFGEITIDEDSIITFEKGIPGFEQRTKFILIVEQDCPCCWMQSIEEPNLAFFLIDPLSFCPEYGPDVDDKYIEMLGEPVIDDLVLYAIVVIPDDIKNMTANLKAPVIINTKTRKGMQVYLEKSNYLMKYNIYDKLNAQQSHEEVGD